VEFGSVLMLILLVIVVYKVFENMYYQNQKYELKYRRDRMAKKD
jgi:hypothetical protein